MGDVINLVEERYIRAKDIQKIFGNIARSTVDNWAKSGILTRHKIAGSVFYESAEVEKLKQVRGL